MSTPKSAKNGSATWDGTAIDDVRNINVGKISEPQKYASSSTAGARKTLGGHKDKSLSFDIYQDEPPMDEGDTGTLVLKSDTGVTLFNGTVHISNLNFGVDVDAGSLITCGITAEPA